MGKMRKIERMFILSAACLFLGFAATGCSSQNPGDTDGPLPGDAAITTPSGSNASDGAGQSGTDSPSSQAGISDASNPNASDVPNGANTGMDKPEPIEYTVSGNQIRFTSYDLTDTYDEALATLIRMDNMEVTITGAGASIQDNKILITQEGTYIFEGSLANGQIYVNVSDQEKVRLVLNNADIFCNTSAPIYIANADKTVITLPEGTVNSVSDSFAPLDDTVKGCIYSKDDLTFNGSGTLNVTGNYNNAISCKNDLTIVGGTYNLTAANNGLKGNDSISILTCTMKIVSMDDGCKVDNDTEAEKGYLFIAGGTFDITANDDCFQSTRAFIIQGGHVLARCYGQIVNCDGYSIGAESYISPGY